MNHKVNNIQNLYDASRGLYEQGIVSGDSGVDSILSALNSRSYRWI